MRILLYSIFTNEYIKLLPLWLELTASRFYPGEADVLVLTDSPEKVESDKVIVGRIDSLKDRNSELLQKVERHLDVLNEFSTQYDVFVHLQANCFIPGELNSSNFSIDPAKFKVFEHIWSGDAIIANSTCRIGSAGWRPTCAYNSKYYFAGMWAGGSDVALNMLHTCRGMFLEDRANNNLDKVPFQDESYLNSWISDNENLIDPVRVGAVSAGPLDMLSGGELCFLADKAPLGISQANTVVAVARRPVGLGNSLAIIAACYAHCRRNGYELKLDAYLADRCKEVIPTWKFAVSDKYRTRYTNPTLHYTPIPPIHTGAICGCFISSKYFSDYKEEIRELYSKLISKVINPGVAGIHIRLGDYLHPAERKVHRSPDVEYIRKALSNLPDDVHTLLVVSDEPIRAMELVKSCTDSTSYLNLQPVLLGEVDSIRVLTSCQDLIMSCSSFSWWAAQLGNHRTVIADKTWYNDPNIITDDIYEDSWTLV